MVDLLGGRKLHRGIARVALTYLAGSYVFVALCGLLFHLAVGPESVVALLLIWAFSPITAPLTFVAAPKLWPGLEEKIGLPLLALLLAASMALAWIAGVMIRRRRRRKRERELKAAAERPAVPVVDIGSPTPPEPESTSFFRGCLAAIGTALRSGASLRRQAVRDWLKSLRPDEDFSGLAFEEAREKLLDLVAERMKEGAGARVVHNPCDMQWLDASIRVTVRLRRAYAWWMLFWALVLPLGTMAVLLVRWAPEEWSVYNGIAVAIILAVGYALCLAVSLIVQNLLLRPFTWAAGRLLGVPGLAVQKPPPEGSPADVEKPAGEDSEIARPRR